MVGRATYLCKLCNAFVQRGVGTSIVAIIRAVVRHDREVSIFRKKRWVSGGGG
jgi:hypothetical protein